MYGLTDKGQIKKRDRLNKFQFLAQLKRSQEGTYLYKTNFIHQDKYQYFTRTYLNPS